MHTPTTRWLRALLGVTVMALALLSGTQVARAADPILIFTPTDGISLTIYIADLRGLFREEGLNVQVRNFGSGAEAAEAFRAVPGHFVLTGDLPALRFWAPGDTLGLTPLVRGSESLIGLGAREIKQAADLKGRRVATRLGSTTEFALLRYLKDNGMGLADIKLVNLDAPEHLPALVNRNVDAIFTFVPVAERAREVLKDQVNLLAVEKSYLILSTSKSFARANPEAVVKVLRALNRATQYIKENPAGAVATVTGKYALQDKVYWTFLNMKGGSPFRMGFDREFKRFMDDLAAFMIEQKRLDRPIDWPSAFDPSFLQKVDASLVTGN